MSLINQMLRDLEQRRKAGVHRLPRVEGPEVQSPQPRSRRPFIMLCSGLLFIGLLWLGLDQFSRQRITPKATVKPLVIENPAEKLPAPQQVEQKKLTEITIQQPQTEVKTPLLATPTAVAKVVGQHTSALVKAGRPPAPPAVAQLLTLNLLEVDFSTRLVFEFEQLPEYSWKFLAADNKQLEIRFEKATLLPKLEVPKLNGPLLTHLSVQAERQDLRLLVRADSPLQLELLTLPSDRLHGPRLLLELSPQAADLEAVPPKQELPVKRPAVSPQPVAADPPAKRVSKTLAKLTAEEQAEHAYREALQQLRRSESLAAEANLAHALSLQPQRLDARLQLVTLLQESGRIGEAEKMLLAGLEISPENPELRKKYARDLMADGHLAAAVDLLQSVPRPTISLDLEYHALLAALQQELGQHRAAAENYRLLLAQRPQAALWWFGLALSLDQSDNVSGAAEAYRQALALPGLRDDLQLYVKGRLQML